MPVSMSVSVNDIESAAQMRERIVGLIKDRIYEIERDEGENDDADSRIEELDYLRFVINQVSVVKASAHHDF
jgi:hypothetical protein